MASASKPKWNLSKKSFQKYPIPNNFENQLGMDWVLPKSIGSVSGSGSQTLITLCHRRSRDADVESPS